jgi:hypothetical protein
MFFPESDSIVRDHPGLQRVVGLVDSQLAKITSADPLRPGDFACVVGADINHVTSVFDLLAQNGVLRLTEMVECARCHTLIQATAFLQAVEDEDDFECPSCDRVVPARTQPISIYRMTEQALGVVAALQQAGADGPDGTAQRVWPDPKEHTTAKAWTLKNGTFCLSTETERNDDGKVEFPMTQGGKPTKQMQLMRLLCYKHPKALAVAQVIEQVYPDELAQARCDAEALKAVLKKVRTLVSDIRNKKLAAAGINPGILSPLDYEITGTAEITLNVVHLHKPEDIGFEDVAWEIGD